MGLPKVDYVVVTTFSPDVKTVERVVELADGRFGFWTADAGEMAGRFAEPQTVVVRICDRGGKVDLVQPLFEGRAVFVAEGPDFEAVKSEVAAKHGWATKRENAVDRAKELFGPKTPEGAVVLEIIG